MRKNVIRMASAMLVLTFAMTACGEEKEEPKATPKPTEAIQLIDIPEEDYTTLKNGVYTSTNGAVQVKVPESWKLSKDSAMVLVAGKEEDTKDCLTVEVTKKDDKFEAYTTKDFQDTYDQLLDNYKAVSYEDTKVAGLPAKCLTYTFSTDNADVTGYEYFVDGNYTYILSFIDVSGKLKDQIPGIIEETTICK